MNLKELLMKLDTLLGDLDELQMNEKDEDCRMRMSKAFDLIDKGFNILDKIPVEE